jgi:hypothetical protein
MEYRYYTSSPHQDVSLKKRKRTDADVPTKMFTPASILTKIDRVDHVVAGVATNTPLIVSSEPNPCQEAKSEPSLQEFYTKMIQDRGYPGSTHSTLSCGYNNKPTVSPLYLLSR